MPRCFNRGRDRQAEEHQDGEPSLTVTAGTLRILRVHCNFCYSKLTFDPCSLPGRSVADWAIFVRDDGLLTVNGFAESHERGTE